VIGENDPQATRHRGVFELSAITRFRRFWGNVYAAMFCAGGYPKFAGVGGRDVVPPDWTLTMACDVGSIADDEKGERER
jgi:hypothetical protein